MPLLNPGDRSGRDDPHSARWCPKCHRIAVQPDQHQCREEQQ